VGPLRQGRILAVQKDAAGARRRVRQDPRARPVRARVLLQRLQRHAGRRRPRKAQALLDSYLKSLKEDDRFHRAYGNLLMKVNKPEDALKHFDKAIDFNNFNAVAHYAKGAALFDARATFLTDPKDTKKRDELFESSKKELDLALEVQEYFPAAHSKLGDILFEKKEWGDGCQSYAQALMQMKTLQAPRERMTELRDKINDRLIKEAKLRDVAKAWMDETGKLIR
jgi:tetratricopeptide (TPR) repeat protein